MMNPFKTLTRYYDVTLDSGTLLLASSAAPTSLQDINKAIKMPPRDSGTYDFWSDTLCESCINLFMAVDGNTEEHEL